MWLALSRCSAASSLPSCLHFISSYQGLRNDLFNPIDESYFTSGSGKVWNVFPKANDTDMPNPDPEEGFDEVTYQLFGPEGAKRNPKWPNLGFVIDYKKATGTNTPVQIMEPFAPDQVPVISALARNFAICDEWYCSIPSDTWPNRSFFHSGTSNGHVVNGDQPNPFL